MLFSPLKLRRSVKAKYGVDWGHQKAFAHEAGIKESSASHYLNGTRAPGLSAMEKLVDALDLCCIYALLDGEHPACHLRGRPRLEIIDKEG